MQANPALMHPACILKPDTNITEYNEPKTADYLSQIESDSQAFAWLFMYYLLILGEKLSSCLMPAPFALWL